MLSKMVMLTTRLVSDMKRTNKRQRNEEDQITETTNCTSVLTKTKCSTTYKISKFWRWIQPPSLLEVVYSRTTCRIPLSAPKNSANVIFHLKLTKRSNQCNFKRVSPNNFLKIKYNFQTLPHIAFYSIPSLELFLSV